MANYGWFSCFFLVGQWYQNFYSTDFSDLAKFEIPLQGSTIKEKGEKRDKIRYLIARWLTNAEEGGGSLCGSNKLLSPSTLGPSIYDENKFLLYLFFILPQTFIHFLACYKLEASIPPEWASHKEFILPQLNPFPLNSLLLFLDVISNPTHAIH